MSLKKMPQVVLEDYREYPERIGRESALCIGNFDGVHSAHEHLIRTLIDRAHTGSLASVLLTFEPHPLDVLSRRGSVKRLTSREVKIRLLRETGLDVIIVQPFTKEFASLTPEAFLERVVVGALRAKVIVIGPDSRFGFGGRGNRAMLEKFGKDFDVEIVSIQPFIKDGRPVSSSHIRSLLDEGNVSEVLSLLGRPYELGGKAIEGRGRGRRIGFPTANLSGVDVMVPKEGVYAAAGGLEGKIYPAAVHIGARRTFDEPFAIEVHFIGRDEDSPLYGKQVNVYLLRRLRDVERFKSAGDLRGQIEKDVTESRSVYDSAKSGIDMKKLLGGGTK
jgi:riboflavin kinase/FMN adenylyltransferase